MSHSRSLPREVLIVVAFLAMCWQIMLVHDGTSLPADLLSFAVMLSLIAGAMLAGNLILWGRRGAELALRIAHRDTDRLNRIADELDAMRRGQHPEIQSVALFAGIALLFGSALVGLGLIIATVYFQQVAGQRILEIRKCAERID